MINGLDLFLPVLVIQGVFMDNDNNLRLSLSPAALTSKACLIGAAANGDNDAENLLHYIQKEEYFADEKNTRDEKFRDELFRFSSLYGNCVWVGNTITDTMFYRLRMMSFVDLGCGLTKRGLTFAKKQYLHYYAYDLPPVIKKLTNALKLSGTWMSNLYLNDYIAADVTDYEALRRPIEEKEPLFISTDGLMMYLTESEMVTVVDNIARLLSEFGGVWFTCDSVAQDLYNNIVGQLFGADGNNSKESFDSIFSERWQSLLFENSFTKLKDNEFSAFLEDHGLYSRKVSVANLLNDLYVPDNIKKAYENISYYMMTSKADADRIRSFEMKSKFKLETLEEGDVFIIGIIGRLDAVTAPQLVEEYDNHTKEKGICRLVLEMTDCIYMSSAGIRAMVMLFKRTKGIKNGFSMRNLRPEVLEILDLTSFTSFVNE